MTKINNYVWIFLGLFTLLSTLLYTVCTKYAPFFLHSTIYYCRELIQSAPMRPLNLNGKFVVLLGFIAFALYTVMKVFLTIRRIIKLSIFLDKKSTHVKTIVPVIKKLQLQNRVQVIRDRHTSAFCFGFINPKIYISTQMLSVTTPNELEAILRHEKHHLEHKDNLVMLFALFTESIFPFFPLLSDVIAQYKTQREIHADSAAIAGMNDGKDHIRSILTKLLQYEVSPNYLFASNFVDAHTLEARINVLTQTQPTIFRLTTSVKNIFISIVSVTILAGLVVAPVHAVELHTSGEDSVMACVCSGKTCTNTCSQDIFVSMATQQFSQEPGPASCTSHPY